jgi:hypothetical protein
MPDDAQSTSPGGRFQIRTDLWEASNSLWIETPEIRDATTDEVLLRFNDERWSLNRSDWESDTRVRVALRKFPGSHTPWEIVATVDCERRIASVGLDTEVALEALESVLERQIAWR